MQAVTARSEAAICFPGHMVRRLSDGQVEVRLANDHLLLARSNLSEGAFCTLRFGEAVDVELATNDVKGWRIARRL